jgi:hypothetical protein
MVSGNGSESGPTIFHPYEDDVEGEEIYTKDGQMIRWYRVSDGEELGRIPLMGYINLMEEAARRFGESRRLRGLRYQIASEIEQLEAQSTQFRGRER